MPPSRRALLASLAALAPLAACASAREDAPSPREAAEAEELLFISPMGEPFRAKPPAPYPVVDWFRGADANKDGRLDRAEFLADAERFFKVLDVNKDGVIDHREVFYYEHRLVPEILAGAAEARAAGPRLILAALQAGPGGVVGSGAPPPDPNQAPRLSGPRLSGGGAAPYNLLGEPEPVQSADIRLTGMISLADFRTRAGQRFDFLDERRRGYLALADLPETDAQRQMQPRARGRRA